jgi:flagellar basal-body rod modification protein FlgD
MSVPAESLSMPASATSAAGSAATTGASNDMLTQSDFLQLMVTQMQNQDPTSPADPSAFLGQLAQMSEVSSLDNMQSSLATLSSSLLSSQAVSGAGLVGHDVLASGTSGNLTAGGSLSGGVQTPAGATSLSVSVADANGNVVNTFSVTPQSGLTAFSWNGTTNTGASAPAGSYTFSVTATVNGQTQTVTPLMESTVQSVTIDQTSQSLDLNTANGVIPMSNVVSVD